MKKIWIFENGVELDTTSFHFLKEFSFVSPVGCVWVCGGKTGIGDNNHQKKSVCRMQGNSRWLSRGALSLSHCGHDERCGTEMEKEATKQTRKQQNIEWRKLTTAPGNIKCVRSFSHWASGGRRAELDPLRISSTQNRPKEVLHFEYSVFSVKID